jgi:integrase
MLALLHKAAMFFGYYPTTANPMKLVEVRTVVGAPKPKPRINLTKDEFRLLLAKFVGMYRVMIMLAACVGLRRSEIFGLKWSDFNWLLRELFVQRSHVEGYEGETKTESSNAKVPLHPTIIEALLAWRLQSSFNADDDYVFASPLLDGKKPLNSNSVQRDYLRPKSVEAGLKPLGWHALRHSYRTWLAELKTGPEVQRDLMRHSTVGMSLDGYGQGVPDLNREANYAVVNSLLAVNPLN